MTKILVTGGSGALGREIVKCLANTGSSVRIMSRNPERHAEQTTTAIEWVQGNLASDQGLAEAVADVDIIVHAATDPLHSRQKRKEALSPGANGCKKIREAVK